MAMSKVGHATFSNDSDKMSGIDYNGPERRKVDIEAIQKEAKEKAEKEVKLALTIESLQKTIEDHGRTINDLIRRSDEHYRNIEAKLADHKEETEEANRREFVRINNQLANLQARVDPIELDYLRREKEKSDANARKVEAIEHGKKTIIASVTVAIVGAVATVAIWIYNAIRANPNP